MTIRKDILVLLISIITTVTFSEPEGDKLSQIPGYPSTFTNRAFAGYLNTDSENRKLHYVFLEANQGVSNSAPVLLWLNGGPGCTSKIGLIQQISPYCLDASQKYDQSANLSFNAYGWSNLTNLLFIDSPAGVGYSINKDANYQYNDANTAKDNLLALKYFFTTAFPEYANNAFYIAGQSYAGKYIPDLATRILQDNVAAQKAINLKGIIIGNPVLNFLDLYENRIEWMISHNIIDPQLFSYWEKSCKKDSESAGCQFFHERYEDLVYRIDQYNIYGDCYGRSGPRQRAIMSDLGLKMSPFYKKSKQLDLKSNLQSGEWCSYDFAIENYLNINAAALKSNTSQKITVCNMAIYQKYKVDPKGSLTQIPALLSQKLKVYLFTGDWDDVVPFTDTYKNLNRMGFKLEGTLTPWTIDGQHAGFIRKYSSGLMVYQVKGAGHQVPLYKRKQSYKMFQKFIYA